MKEHEKFGKILIIISIAAMVIVFLLSSGYYPQAGFIYSLQNTMHLVNFSINEGAIRSEACISYEYDCLQITIQTKYVMAFLAALVAYGVLIHKELLKNPLSYFSKTESPK